MEVVNRSGGFILSTLVCIRSTIGRPCRMSFKKYHILLLFSLVLHCHALNCRSDNAPKEDELKTMYRRCLKNQETKNSSQSRGYSDHDWRDSKGQNQNQKSSWDKDGKNSRDGVKSRDERSRDDGMYRDDTYRDERTNYDRTGHSGTNFDRMGGNMGYERTGSNYDRIGNNYDRIGSNYDRNYGTGGYERGGNSGSSYGYDRMNDRDDRMTNRDDRLTRSDGMGSRSDMMGRNNDGYGRSQVSGREDFTQNDEFGEDMSPYNSYRPSTPSSRRFRREKRIGTNSGQRSQYNPNVPSRSSYDDHRNEDRDKNSNSSNNSSKNDHTACAMHCFLENLEMIGDNGMPDRYLVTHAITKDVKNEDLRDFLQESIEECFQILDNENTDDKCEFSKNLLMCLSEKGRANCDDWKEDIQF